MDEKVTDQEAYGLALKVAQAGAGFVSPNPLVGCVILDAAGELLATGYHAVYGGPHAEAAALNTLREQYSEAELSQKLKGARVFVTLEPCAHEGKTPSCAKALAKFALAEVHYGLQDPNPLVSGQGGQILEQAGIRTQLWPADYQTELEATCEHFLMNFRKQQAFVSIKVASSLDGMLALKNGESRWITGEPARLHGHYLRATHDALLVGAGTILQDNPELTIRHPQFPGKKQKLIVLDPEGLCFKKPELQIFQKHAKENLWFVVSAHTALAAKSSSQAQVIEGPTLPVDPKSFDLKELLRQFRTRGVFSVLVEGGAQTISSFITQKEAHRLNIFQAPILLGGASGVGWTNQVNIETMRDRLSLREAKRLSLGTDQLITGRLN
jgi:diaminohydroxyphosphoribosylaminopyrimidine deaminase/5-amino-6-(5-phosphoribosylamino)uracil reductase